MLLDCPCPFVEVLGIEVVVADLVRKIWLSYRFGACIACSRDTSFITWITDSSKDNDLSRLSRMLLIVSNSGLKPVKKA